MDKQYFVKQFPPFLRSINIVVGEGFVLLEYSVLCVLASVRVRVCVRAREEKRAREWKKERSGGANRG